MCIYSKSLITAATAPSLRFSELRRVPTVNNKCIETQNLSNMLNMYVSLVMKYEHKIFLV